MTCSCEIGSRSNMVELQRGLTYLIPVACSESNRKLRGSWEDITASKEKRVDGKRGRWHLKILYYQSSAP